MILAVAAHVEAGAPPPLELIWYWRTARYGLPYGGGWMEQPAGLLDRISEVGSTYEALREYRQNGTQAGQAAKWRKDHQYLAEIVDRVRKLKHGS